MKNIAPFKQFMREQKEAFVEYDKKILIIGYGSVGQAILPLILRHVTTNPKNITVIEKDDNKKRFDERNKGNGVKYARVNVVESNLSSTLVKYLEPDGFVIDCSLNINVDAIMKWCWEHDVLYLNTSLERWLDQQDETIPNLAKRTLYDEHNVVRKFASDYPNASTAVVTHGANPGLVSHLTKRAVLELARRKKKATKAPSDQEGWAQLLKSLGVKVIHIAERDTQIIDEPKEKNEFVNTWSCEGFWAEGRAPAEMGWGTHEDVRPEGGKTIGHVAYLEQPGLSVLMKSWVPLGGSYNGFCVQHSESITMSEYFTTKDGKYRPSVYYVYQPCDAALASVHETRGRELDLQSKTRIIKDEIVSGIDELGVLLLGDDFGMWHGSQLSVEEARALIPGESATSLQVVASMLGAIIWAIENPNMGYIEPDQIPFDFILKYADPYLGPTPFVMTDWSPGKDMNSLFYREYDESNKCSFANFRVWS